MAAIDAVGAMAPAVAAPGGDIMAISLLGAFIAEQTRADLNALALAAESSEPELASGLAAIACETTRFEAAWRPHMGGLLQLRRCPSERTWRSVAGEIVQAEARPISPMGEPFAAAGSYRTPEDEERGCEQATIAHRQCLAAGLALLGRLGRQWQAWVTGSVRQVGPLPDRGREIASWSSLFYPGLVSMTLLKPPVDVAETLVHEAAHQWWHMLDRVVPLVEPDARALPVHSPVKGCSRPLPSLALTFHAFGNIALFFAAMRAEGLLDDAGWAVHSADLYCWLPDIASTLAEAGGLTTDGRTLNASLQCRLERDFYPLEAVAAA